MKDYGNRARSLIALQTTRLATNREGLARLSLKCVPQKERFIPPPADKERAGSKGFLAAGLGFDAIESGLHVCGFIHQLINYQQSAISEGTSI
jgi:hypothetical protein